MQSIPFNSVLQLTATLEQYFENSSPHSFNRKRKLVSADEGEFFPITRNRKIVSETHFGHGTIRYVQLVKVGKSQTLGTL